MAHNLLERQQKIIDGKVSASSRNIVGVTLQANRETIDSVPYLTHMDFCKGIKELNELCDYVSIDLSREVSSAGIMQYYKNPSALEKLLRETNRARMLEVGKAVALEYEQMLSKTGQANIDYSNSVGRGYQRNCLVSTVRPLLLMIQVDTS